MVERAIVLIQLYKSVGGAECHWLWTWPHHNVTDTLAKGGPCVHETMEVNLGTTNSKDAPTESMRLMPDRPPVPTRQKVEAVIADLSAVVVTIHSTKP